MPSCKFLIFNCFRFYPIITEMVEQDNWENQIKKFMECDDSGLSFNQIDLRKYYIYVFQTNPEKLTESEKKLKLKVTDALETKEKFHEF